jgi:hypothetical protein
MSQSNILGSLNPSKINYRLYIGLKVSDLVSIIPHDYRIRVLNNTERTNEVIKSHDSITLNIVVDKNNVITKVLGYYN